MNNKEIKKLKKELNKILNTLSTLKEKEQQSLKLNEKYNVVIEIATDGIGVLGAFVSKDNEPLFAITTNFFKKYLKEQKEEFYNKIYDVLSQTMWSNNKKEKEISKLGEDFQVDIKLENNKLIIDESVSRWLYFETF